MKKKFTIFCLCAVLIIFVCWTVWLVVIFYSHNTDSHIAKEYVIKCFTPVLVNEGETLDDIYYDICDSYECTLTYEKSEWIEEVEYMNPINNGKNYELVTIIVPFLVRENDIHTYYECGYYIPF